MATMVQLLRHIVEACNEAESMAEELSGRLAEQDIVNPIGLGCSNVREWPQSSVMLWHSKIRCEMDA